MKPTNTLLPTLQPSLKTQTQKSILKPQFNLLFKKVLGCLSIIFLMFISSCEEMEESLFESEVITHEVWDDLLSKHVSVDGVVDYDGLSNDRTQFDSYTDLLSANPPGSNWSPDETKAYWINAYNAFTVQLILNNSPLGSIMDINNAFGRSFIQIGDSRLSLNAIEHEKLRRDTEDPRIHFAINCASQSCPILLNSAYVAEKLEEQLEAQTAIFVNNTNLNDLTDVEKIKLSRIFQWFKIDFNDAGGVIPFINQYYTGPTPIATNAMISYLEYDWNLNN